MRSFADFIAPFNPVEFKTRYYGKQSLYISRHGQPFANPLSWQRFNQLLDIAPYWNEDTLKLSYKSRSALVENYCDLARGGLGKPAPADARKVRALAGLGASIVTNAVHKISPEIGAIAQLLGREFAAHCVANAYCSFKGIQAFSTHFDLHDVLALQVEGEKLWHVYEARADNPVNFMPPGDEGEQWLIGNRGRLLFEVTMRPGDILYLPRGQFHDAITGAAASLHVTFGIEPATGLALFELLEAQAVNLSEFRASLPDAADAEKLGPHLELLGRLLLQLASSPAFALDVRNHQRGLWSQPPTFDLPNQHRPRYYAQAGSFEFRSSPAGPMICSAHGEQRLGALWPAIDWLLKQRRAASIEDLMARCPFVDEGELQSVLKALVELGILTEVDIS